LHWQRKLVAGLRDQANCLLLGKAACLVFGNLKWLKFTFIVQRTSNLKNNIIIHIIQGHLILVTISLQYGQIWLLQLEPFHACKSERKDDDEWSLAMFETMYYQLDRFYALFISILATITCLPPMFHAIWCFKFWKP